MGTHVSLYQRLTHDYLVAKITGRTEDGWGLASSMESRNTYAEIQDTNTLAIREELVEPITNYNMLVLDKS